MKKYGIFLCLLLLHNSSFSQSYKWHNPADEKKPVVHGIGWQTGLAHIYDRLPEKAEQSVRREIWTLAKNSAGEYISFKTTANTIVIRYQVAGGLAMNHMPATGVSGVDLYALDISNKWRWTHGNYNFKDTIEYTFNNIWSPTPIKEFRLYLPLYNALKWLEIGVPANENFSFLEIERKKSLVFYGTSIMQGACASRPGLSWINILNRAFTTPVVNLGFSGNGKLEPELIDLLSELDAHIFVLDCQPNLYDKKTYSAEEIENRIRNSVKLLRLKHPTVPVLLAEHCCGTNGVNIDTAMTNKYKWTSEVLNNTFSQMKKEGVPNIYIITAKEFGFDTESTVDGTHPTDIGMKQYADAYEKKIKDIMNAEF